MRCDTRDCDERASFVVYWPGRDALYFCWTCTERVFKVATGQAIHLAVDPLLKRG